MIAQAQAPCYVPIAEDGHQHEYGEGVPHWATAEQASEGIRQIAEHDRGLILTVGREEFRCWHLTCDGCGYRFDEEEWVSHFPERSDIDEILLADYEWTADGEKHYCAPCSEDGAA